MTIRWIRAAAMSGVAGMVLSFASCASGPTYAEMQADLPPIPAGKGRVFVYRPSGVGMAVKPMVKIDGTEVGRSEGRGFFYSDQTVGAHEVSTQTEWKHKDTVHVKANEPSFVRCDMRMGLLVGHVVPKSVDRTTGEQEIRELKHSGD